MKKILIVLILPFLAVVSCKKENPPAMPPAESLVMDFKAFGGTSPQQKSEMLKYAVDSTVQDSSNFVYAKTNVGFWNLIIVVTLAVPVAAWYAAIGNNDWKQVDDHTWQWKYTYKVFVDTYNARLVANNEAADGIKWEMYISKTTGLNTFAEVKWYEGLVAKDGMSGQWILNENPQNPTPFLQVNWQKTGDKVGYIKYTYIRQKDDQGNDIPYYNNYIEYGKTTNAPFDCYYTMVLYDTWWTKQNNTINIEWNSTDLSGRVKSPLKFNDSEWHCWNSQFYNITCQ